MIPGNRDKKGMTDPVPREGVAEIWWNPVFFPGVFLKEIYIVLCW